MQVSYAHAPIVRRLVATHAADYALAMRSLLLLVMVTASLLMSACGVAFSGSEGNDFFKSIDVAGSKTTGSPLSVTVAYKQKYPVDVTVACEIRQGKHLVQVIGERDVASIEGGGPEATPVPGSATFEFRIDDPGSYRAECYTPADEDNYIRENFTVVGRSALGRGNR